MQPYARPITSRTSGSRRLLLVLLVIVAAVVVVGLLLVRTGHLKLKSSTAAPKAAQAVRKKPAHHRTVRATRPATPSPVDRNPSLADRKTYAAALISPLDRSVRVFDAAVRSMRADGFSFGALSSTCASYTTRIEVVEYEYEGVPHPYPWWTPVGTLHHRISGIYHYSLGAMQNCLEAVAISDTGTASLALSEMSTGARDLHAMDQYARYLAAQR